MWNSEAPLCNGPTWIVVADRSIARIFTSRDTTIGDLTEIQTLIHSEGACQPHEVQSDRPGIFVGHNGARCAGEPKSDLRHQAATDFACQIAAALDKGRIGKQLGRLVVIAPDLMLGMLRKHLPQQIKRMVIAELDKNLAHCHRAELAEHIRQVLVRGGTVLR